MLNVVVLVSGGGTNLQAIIDAVDSGVITNTKIAGVISNNKNAYIFDRKLLRDRRIRYFSAFHRSLPASPPLRGRFAADGGRGFRTFPGGSRGVSRRKTVGFRDFDQPLKKMRPAVLSER